MSDEFRLNDEMAKFYNHDFVGTTVDIEAIVPRHVESVVLLTKAQK